MTRAPVFAETERRFLKLISQRRPLGEVASEPLSSWIRGGDESYAVARLGVYAHMYFARLRDSLREDFACFARLVSEAQFDRIAARYLELYPSDRASLRHHGRHFAEFVAAGFASEAHPTLALRADAAALCRLEWARIEAFDAPAAAVLTREVLSAFPPELWSDLGLTLIPALRLLEPAPAVSALWSALQMTSGAACWPEPSVELEQLLVWRRGLRVYHRPVDPGEARVLAALRQGTSFGAVCEVLCRFEGDLERAGERALALLSQWLVDEIVVLT